MNMSSDKQISADSVSIDDIIQSLRDKLPDIARELIDSTHDTSDPLTQKFLKNVDSPAEHSPLWHQFGILTHSEKFREYIEFDAVKFLKQWGILDASLHVLTERVDGIAKQDLLQVVALVHDLGKFTARTFEYEQGQPLARFHNHEAQSGKIVRITLKSVLQDLGLSEAQIEYIAGCAEYHFELGKARRAARDTIGYTIKFAQSKEFFTVAKDIINSYPQYALEIGLMFIADSLSKTDIASTATTDEAIEQDRPRFEQDIKDKNIDPRLINQALQQPINIEIAKQYLQIWANQQK